MLYLVVSKHGFLTRNTNTSGIYLSGIYLWGWGKSEDRHSFIFLQNAIEVAERNLAGEKYLIVGYYPSLPGGGDMLQEAVSFFGLNALLV